MPSLKRNWAQMRRRAEVKARDPPRSIPGLHFCHRGSGPSFLGTETFLDLELNNGQYSLRRRTKEN